MTRVRFERGSGAGTAHYGDYSCWDFERDLRGMNVVGFVGQVPRDLVARRALSRCLSLCRRRRGNLSWALTRQFVGVQKDPFEDDNMQALGVSRFDVPFGPGWRVWTNVEGGVRETLELSSRDR